MSHGVSAVPAIGGLEASATDLPTKGSSAALDEVITLMERAHEVMQSKERTGLLKKKIEDITAGEYFIEGRVAYAPKTKGTLFVVGDTHGDYLSLQQFLEQSEFIERVEQGENVHVAILGDLTDEGGSSLENLKAVLTLILSYPEHVTLVRGNHDFIEEGIIEREMARRDGDILENWFIDQLEIYSQDERDSFLASYNRFMAKVPALLCFPNNIVIAHNGVPTLDREGTEDRMKDGLLSISSNAPLVVDSEESAISLQWEIIWNFVNSNKIEQGDRELRFENGEWSFARYWAGERSFNRFMDAIGGNIMIRGHSKDDPLDRVIFDRRFITIITTGKQSPVIGDTYKHITARYGVFDLSKRYTEIDPSECIVELDNITKATSAGEFKAAIFDFDGVVINSVPYHFKAWKIALDEGFRMYPQKYGDDREISLAEFHQSISGVVNEVVLQVKLVHHSVAERAEIMTRKRELFKEFIAGAGDIRSHSAIRLIKKLKADGIKVALGTASADVHSTLVDLELQELFDAVVDGTGVTDKTKTGIFKKAAQELGVEPQKCAVFEDAKTGVDSAIEAGMVSVGIDQTDSLHMLDDADLVVESLEEVDLPRIRELFAQKASSPGNAIVQPFLKAAIFDLDGVLLDTVDTHYRVWKDIVEAERRKPGYDYEVKDVTREEFLEKVYGRPSLEAMIAMLPGHSPELLGDLVTNRREIFLGHFFQGEIVVVTEVRDFIAKLQGQNIRLAVVSSIKGAGRILRTLGIDHLFDVIADGTSIPASPAHTKVHIYDFALNKLKLRPRECIAFEDSVPGIKAARDSGILCIGTSRKNKDFLSRSADAALDYEQLKIAEVESIFSRESKLHVRSFGQGVLARIGGWFGIDMVAMQRVLDFYRSRSPLRSTLREPTTAWESLYCYVAGRRFYLNIVEDVALLARNTDHNFRTLRFVDGILSSTTLDGFLDPDTNTIYSLADLLTLSAEMQSKATPVYVINIGKVDLARYQDGPERTQFLAKVLVREWVEHFMPYYIRDADGADIEYNKLFEPSALHVGYISDAVSSSNIRALYNLLTHYCVYEDPAGTLKQMIYEAIDLVAGARGILFLVKELLTDEHLIAWYRYQFEHNRLNVSQISALLQQHSTRSPIAARNLSSENNAVLFNFTHPITSQTLYLPQNLDPSKMDGLEPVELVDPEQILGLTAKIRETEVEKGEIASEISRLRGEKRGLGALLAGPAPNLDASTRATTLERLEELNGRIAELDETMHGLSQRQIYIYAEELIRQIEQRISQIVAAKERCGLGIWGGSSTGKNTLCEIIQNTLYAHRRFSKEDNEVLVLGSDNYLHTGLNGRYIEVPVLDGVMRFSVLKGQGIFDLKALAADLARVKHGHPIELFPDLHSNITDRREMAPVVIDDVVKLVLGNFAALGLDKNVVEELDLILAVDFADGRNKLARMLTRDRKQKEEGGPRSFSTDEVIRQFVVHHFSEKEDAMYKALPAQAHFLWQQDAFRLFRVAKPAQTMGSMWDHTPFVDASEQVSMGRLNKVDLQIQQAA